MQVVAMTNIVSHIGLGACRITYVLLVVKYSRPVARDWLYEANVSVRNVLVCDSNWKSMVFLESLRKEQSAAEKFAWIRSFS